MSFRFIIFLSLVFCLKCFFGQAQTNPNYEFILHLTEGNKNREALYLLDHSNELSQPDTVNYLKGMNYYYLKLVDSAAVFLSEVSPASGLHTREN